MVTFDRLRRGPRMCAVSEGWHSPHRETVYWLLTSDETFAVIHHKMSRKEPGPHRRTRNIQCSDRGPPAQPGTHIEVARQFLLVLREGGKGMKDRARGVAAPNQQQVGAVVHQRVAAEIVRFDRPGQRQHGTVEVESGAREIAAPYAARHHLPVQISQRGVFFHTL